MAFVALDGWRETEWVAWLDAVDEAAASARLSASAAYSTVEWTSQTQFEDAVSRIADLAGLTRIAVDAAVDPGFAEFAYGAQSVEVFDFGAVSRVAISAPELNVGLLDAVANRTGTPNVVAFFNEHSLQLTVRRSQRGTTQVTLPDPRKTACLVAVGTPSLQLWSWVSDPVQSVCCTVTAGQGAVLNVAVDNRHKAPEMVWVELSDTTGAFNARCDVAAAGATRTPGNTTFTIGPVASGFAAVDATGYWSPTPTLPQVPATWGPIGYQAFMVTVR